MSLLVTDGEMRPGESQGIVQAVESGMEPGLDPPCPLFHANFQHYIFFNCTWGTFRPNLALRFTQEKIPRVELLMHGAGKKEWVEIPSSW